MSGVGVLYVDLDPPKRDLMKEKQRYLHDGSYIPHFNFKILYYIDYTFFCAPIKQIQNDSK